MPNWCQNTVVVRGEAAEISAFNDWLDDGKGLLTKIKPTPQPLVDTIAGWSGNPEEQKKIEEMSAANLKEYGYANWYDWSYANWGTKWDVDAEIDDVSSINEQVIFSFESAWAPPQKAICLMAEKFPKLTIRHSYLEEGVGFVGYDKYEGGGLIEDAYNEDSNTDEWKQLATDEFGWEPWPDDDEELKKVEVTESIKPAEKPAKKKVKKKVKKNTKKVTKKTKSKAKAKKK